MKRKCVSFRFLLIVLGLFGVTMLLNGGVSSAHADDVVDHVKVTVPPSCSFSEVQTPDNSEYSVVMHTGEYKPEIGSTTFRVYCNDTNGYSVYAIGYSNNEYGNTEMVHDSDSAFNFHTGIATSGSASNWAMKLTPVSGTYAPTIQSDVNGSYLDYHVVPSAYTKVATFPSITDSPTEQDEQGSAFQSNYAIWIAAGQATGTYTSKVRYTLVHPAGEEAPPEPQPTTAGYINYYANATTAEGTMGRQAAADGDTVTLFASNFSRDGYGFAGWSDAFDYATNPDAHFYGPNEDITVPTGTTANGLALYAVWVKSVGNLQDTVKVAELCGSGGTGGSLTAAVYNDEGDADESTWSITAGLSSVSALTDTRDGQTYAIAKLADGRCWMIENLRLADTHQEGANTVPTTLTVANTNNPLNDSDLISPTVTLKHNYADTQTFTNLSPTSDVTYNADTAPGGWCSDDSTACDDQSRIRTDNTANRVSYQTTETMASDANIYSYGNYYNWYSATAGRGTYRKSSGNTAGDICPAGWHLPIGAGDGEFGLLSNSLGGYQKDNGIALRMDSATTPTATIMLERIRHFPNNLLFSGYVSGVSIINRGIYGWYWSSTAGGSKNAYGLHLSSSGISPGTTRYSKYYGIGTRCMVWQ